MVMVNWVIMIVIGLEYLESFRVLDNFIIFLKVFIGYKGLGLLRY